METYVAQMDLYAVLVLGFVMMVGMVGVGYALFAAGRIACRHLRPAPARLNTYCKYGARMRVHNA